MYEWIDLLYVYYNIYILFIINYKKSIQRNYYLIYMLCVKDYKIYFMMRLGSGIKNLREIQ